MLSTDYTACRSAILQTRQCVAHRQSGERGGLALPRVDFACYLTDVTRAMLQSVGQPADASSIQAIFRQSRVSYSTLIIGLLYLLRYTQSPATAVFGATSDGKVTLAVCLLLASKFLQDRNASNAAWCALAGIPLPLFNQAECRFLTSIEHRLCVSEPVFAKWADYLLRNAQSTASACKKDLRFAPQADAATKNSTAGNKRLRQLQPSEC